MNDKRCRMTTVTVINSDEKNYESTIDDKPISVMWEFIISMGTGSEINILLFPCDTT